MRTRSEVWTRKLLYLGHTFPTAFAPFWLWRSLGFSTFALPPLITLPLAALIAHAV